jgi:ribosome-associated protein
MTTPTTDKKDTQKLQRAIVDGLEDVKAVDIVVFDTEHLSALFERVIIASGSSNRQTKALAASVRDAVREAGFPKPRVEGEANGEWIIVDCAQAVVHIMQPNFRQYYHLEELWGERPVRLKLGSAKPAGLVKASTEPQREKAPTTLKRASAAKKGVAEAFPSKAQVKKSLATAKAAQSKATGAKSTAKTAPKPLAKPASKTVVVNAPVRAAATKSAVGKPAAKKSPAGKAPARKAPAKKAAPRKS